MKVEVVTKNVKNESEIKEYTLQKVQFALDRIDARIKHVTVRLEDETKASPVFDGRCRIEVDIHPRGHIHVSAEGQSAHGCVLLAVRKMERAAKHEIDRNRRSSKIRHNHAKQQVIDLMNEEV